MNLYSLIVTSIILCVIPDATQKNLWEIIDLRAVTNHNIEEFYQSVTLQSKFSAEQRLTLFENDARISLISFFGHH